MQIITSIADMQSLADSFRRQGRTIGFVPTMGFLHEGHCSLMRYARKNSDIVVSSIFVNPTQFGPHEDYDRYPRDEAGDITKCESSGVDVLFMPAASAMYPAAQTVSISIDGISDILEGAIRPGHFRGVATVVTKLFNIVKPHRVFFGQKDFQQCVIIRRLVAGLNLDLEVVVLPTVREQDGLAMSSRNSYLNPQERKRAAVLHRALTEAERMAMAGVSEPDKLKNKIMAVLREETGIAIDYIEVADPETLVPLAEARGSLVILIAARLGSTRLIDNIIIQRA